jgi:hypothetical protein
MYVCVCIYIYIYICYIIYIYNIYIYIYIYISLGTIYYMPWVIKFFAAQSLQTRMVSLEIDSFVFYCAASLELAYNCLGNEVAVTIADCLRNGVFAPRQH